MQLLALDACHGVLGEKKKKKMPGIVHTVACSPAGSVPPPRLQKTGNHES